MLGALEVAAVSGTQAQHAQSFRRIKLKIGIVIFSRTGHTLSVVTKLVENLAAVGHTATLEQLKPVGRFAPGMREVPLEAPPDPAPYDALVFGAAVEGGMLSGAMTSYLKQVPSLQGKRVACLVAQGFPFSSWGGVQSVAQMKALVEAKGGRVVGSSIVHRMSLRRAREVAEAAEHLAALLEVGQGAG